MELPYDPCQSFAALSLSATTTMPLARTAMSSPSSLRLTSSSLNSSRSSTSSLSSSSTRSSPYTSSIGSRRFSRSQLSSSPPHTGPDHTPPLPQDAPPFSLSQDTTQSTQQNHGVGGPFLRTTSIQEMSLVSPSESIIFQVYTPLPI